MSSKPLFSSVSRPEVALEVTRCPFCRTKLAPAAPRLKSAYLRCDACGQLWHPERLQSTQFVNRNRR